MVAWGPIIGAGLSAIGSFFGGDDDEKVVRQEVDYRKMAQNAEKAGFNPLTAIRNGGSAGFTNTYTPALSAADRFGAMFQTLGNAIMSFDPRADERANLEQDLLRAQIQHLNQSNAADAPGASMFGNVPVATAPTVKKTPVVVAGGTGIDGGKPQNMWVEWIDNSKIGGGKSVWSINPAYGDFEQAALGASDSVTGEILDDARSDVNKLKKAYEQLGRPQPNPKIRGNPQPAKLPPLSMPNVIEETKQWFKPWEGVFW